MRRGLEFFTSELRRMAQQGLERSPPIEPPTAWRVARRWTASAATPSGKHEINAVCASRMAISDESAAAMGY
ncbi:hypothetical protein [Baekduia sp. Peel2402]|uniref:hypothetical protein n=1 Tax=Baekduia sp. Peel2402 TaxID=3458296 RepID=UPI00403EE191